MATQSICATSSSTIRCEVGMRSRHNGRNRATVGRNLVGETGGSSDAPSASSGEETRPMVSRPESLAQRITPALFLVLAVGGAPPVTALRFASDITISRPAPR